MFPYEKYLRLNRLPHIWCTGCGCGIVLKALLRAIARCNIPKDDVALVSGIGCSSRTSGYVDFNTLHTTHGRAIAFATGLKLAKPKLTLIVVTGDGDATAIGGNHFIHGARRNMDMTVIIYNNHTYGMTGGQVSPTTPIGNRASTAPYGNIEPAFDISELGIAAGASFVARSTCYHATQLDKLIARGILKKGFSLIEVLSPCPTYYGRFNRLGTSVDMLRWYKENSIAVERARKMSDEERRGKIVIGVLHDIERSEFCEEYQRLIKRVHGIRR
jgi:2-oxoglutarate ferredoxin oxidoreductase subunit beta